MENQSVVRPWGFRTEEVGQENQPEPKGGRGGEFSRIVKMILYVSSSLGRGSWTGESTRGRRGGGEFGGKRPEYMEGGESLVE